MSLTCSLLLRCDAKSRHTTEVLDHEICDHTELQFYNSPKNTIKKSNDWVENGAKKLRNDKTL